MVKGALKAHKLWRSHNKMHSRSLYLKMLTGFLQGVSGVGQFRGFDFVDSAPRREKDVGTRFTSCIGKAYINGQNC